MQTKQQMPYVCDAFIFELHIGCAFNYKCIHLKQTYIHSDVSNQYFIFTM